MESKLLTLKGAWVHPQITLQPSKCWKNICLYLKPYSAYIPASPFCSPILSSSAQLTVSSLEPWLSCWTMQGKLSVSKDGGNFKKQIDSIYVWNQFMFEPWFQWREVIMGVRCWFGSCSTHSLCCCGDKVLLCRPGCPKLPVESRLASNSWFSCLRVGIVETHQHT